MKITEIERQSGERMTLVSESTGRKVLWNGVKYLNKDGSDATFTTEELFDQEWEITHVEKECSSCENIESPGEQLSELIEDLLALCNEIPKKQTNEGDSFLRGYRPEFICMDDVAWYHDIIDPEHLSLITISENIDKFLRSKGFLLNDDFAMKQTEDEVILYSYTLLSNHLMDGGEENFEKSLSTFEEEYPFGVCRYSRNDNKTEQFTDLVLDEYNEKINEYIEKFNAEFNQYGLGIKRDGEYIIYFKSEEDIVNKIRYSDMINDIREWPVDGLIDRDKKVYSNFFIEETDEEILEKLFSYIKENTEIDDIYCENDKICYIMYETIVATDDKDAIVDWVRKDIDSAMRTKSLELSTVEFYKSCIKKVLLNYGVIVIDVNYGEKIIFRLLASNLIIDLFVNYNNCHDIIEYAISSYELTKNEESLTVLDIDQHKYFLENGIYACNINNFVSERVCIYSSDGDYGYIDIEYFEYAVDVCSSSELLKIVKGYIKQKNSLVDDFLFSVYKVHIKKVFPKLNLYVDGNMIRYIVDRTNLVYSIEKKDVIKELRKVPYRIVSLQAANFRDSFASRYR